MAKKYSKEDIERIANTDPGNARRGFLQNIIPTIELQGMHQPITWGNWKKTPVSFIVFVSDGRRELLSTILRKYSISGRNCRYCASVSAAAIVSVTREVITQCQDKHLTKM